MRKAFPYPMQADSQLLPHIDFLQTHYILHHFLPQYFEQLSLQIESRLSCLLPTLLYLGQSLARSWAQKHVLGEKVNVNQNHLTKCSIRPDLFKRKMFDKHHYMEDFVFLIYANRRDYVLELDQ